MDFGGKNILATVVNQVNSHIDVIMIVFLAGNANAGIYSFAATVSKGLYLIPAIVQENFNPIISNLWAKSETNQLNYYVRKIRKTMFFIMLPAIFVVIILYPFFVNTFMNSPEYQESFSVFYILLIGVSIFSIMGWAGGMLMMGGYLMENLKRIIVLLLVNIIGNAALIPLFGINGAAAATSFSIIVALFLLRYYIKKNMRIKIF